MASYPTTPVIFPARSDGQTIFSQHVNALQDEIAALEASLVGGTLPSPQRITGGGRPALILDPGAPRLGRVQTVPNQTLLMHNISYDGANWNLDDTANAGSMLALNPLSGLILMYYAAPGANPRPITQILQLDSAGNMTIPGGLSVGSMANLALTGTLSAGNITATNVISAGNGFVERGRTTQEGFQQSYTPVWQSTGTAPALGNGTLTGLFWEMGYNTVYVQVSLTVGSTSTPGTGAMLFTLPPGRAEGGAQFIMNGRISHGAATYMCQGVSAGGSRFQLHAWTAASTMVQVTNAVPFVWAAGDTVTIAGMYSGL